MKIKINNKFKFEEGFLFHNFHDDDGPLYLSFYCTRDVLYRRAFVATPSNGDFVILPISKCEEEEICKMEYSSRFIVLDEETIEVLEPIDAFVVKYLETILKGNVDKFNKIDFNYYQ